MIKDFIQKSASVTVDVSDKAHQHDIILMNKGDHKFSPTRGVGLIGYVGDEENGSELDRNIASEFNRDGMAVRSVEIVNKELSIDAYYRS